MSDFFNKAEQALDGFQGQGSGGNSNDQQDSNNQQDDRQQDNNQGQDSQQSGQTQNQGSSGSFLGGAAQAGEDGLINTEVNQFLNKEGLPAGADGAADAFIDKEANSYLGGNKNF